MTSEMAVHFLDSLRSTSQSMLARTLFPWALAVAIHHCVGKEANSFVFFWWHCHPNH